MKNLRKVLEIFELINEQYNNDELKSSLKIDLIKNLLRLYSMRAGQYVLRNAEIFYYDITFILEWLIKNDTPNIIVYKTLLADFHKQVERNTRAKDGFPVIYEFTVDKPVVVSGVKIKFNWGINNAQNVILSDDLGQILTKGHFDTEIVALAGDSTIIRRYTLQAINNSGKDEKQLEVTIYPVPRLELINTPFPAIEIITHIQMNIAAPILDTSVLLEQLLNNISYYPPIMTSMGGSDLFDEEKKSIFNIFHLYGRIRASLRKTNQ